MYDGQDTTKVIIQYYIVFIYYSSNVHLSPYYQTTRGQVLILGRAIASLLDDIDQVESVESTSLSAAPERPGQKNHEAGKNGPRKIHLRLVFLTS